MNLTVCARRGCGMLTSGAYCSPACAWDASESPVLTWLEWACKVGLYGVIVPLVLFLLGYHGGRWIGWLGP